MRSKLGLTSVLWGHHSLVMLDKHHRYGIRASSSRSLAAGFSCPRGTKGFRKLVRRRHWAAPIESGWCELALYQTRLRSNVRLFPSSSSSLQQASKDLTGPSPRFALTCCQFERALPCDVVVSFFLSPHRGIWALGWMHVNLESYGKFLRSMKSVDYWGIHSSDCCNETLRDLSGPSNRVSFVKRHKWVLYLHITVHLHYNDILLVCLGFSQEEKPLCQITTSIACNSPVPWFDTCRSQHAGTFLIPTWTWMKLGTVP